MAGTGESGAAPPVAVSRWSRTATGFTGVAAIAVVVLAAVPYFAGGPAEAPLITLLTFVAMASLWNLLAGFSGLTSFGQHAYIGLGAYGLYLVAAGGAGAVGALIALQTLYVEPTSVFNIQYSVYMLFMVMVGEMGTIEGPVLGALVLFGLQEALSSQGAWYLVIVGGLAVIATLVASRGLWGLASDRFGWSLLPVGYRVRQPCG